MRVDKANVSAGAGDSVPPPAGIPAIAPAVAGATGRNRVLEFGLDPAAVIPAQRLVDILLERVPWLGEVQGLYQRPASVATHLWLLGMIPEAYVLRQGRYVFYRADRIDGLIRHLTTTPRRYNVQEMALRAGVDETRLKDRLKQGKFLAKLAAADIALIPVVSGWRVLDEENLTRLLQFLADHPLQERDTSYRQRLEAPCRARGMMTLKEAADLLKGRHPDWPYPVASYLAALRAEVTGGHVLAPDVERVQGSLLIAATVLAGVDDRLRRHHDPGVITVTDMIAALGTPRGEGGMGLRAMLKAGLIPEMRPWAEIAANGERLVAREIEALRTFHAMRQGLGLAGSHSVAWDDLALSRSLLGDRPMVEHCLFFLQRHPLRQVAVWLETTPEVLRTQIESGQPALGMVLRTRDRTDTLLDYRQVSALRRGVGVRLAERTHFKELNVWLAAALDWNLHVFFSPEEMAQILWVQANGVLADEQELRPVLDFVYQYCQHNRITQVGGRYYLTSDQARSLRARIRGVSKARTNGGPNYFSKDFKPPSDALLKHMQAPAVTLAALAGELQVNEGRVRDWADRGLVPGFPAFAALPRSSELALLVPAKLAERLRQYAQLRQRLAGVFPHRSDFWVGLPMAAKFFAADPSAPVDEKVPFFTDGLIDFVTRRHSLRKVATWLGVDAEGLSQTLGHPDVQLGRVYLIDGVPHLTCYQIGLLEKFLSNGQPLHTSRPTAMKDLDHALASDQDFYQVLWDEGDISRAVLARSALTGSLRRSQRRYEAWHAQTFRLGAHMVAGMTGRQRIGSHYFFRGSETYEHLALLLLAADTLDKPRRTILEPPARFIEFAGTHGVDLGRIVFRLWLTQRLVESLAVSAAADRLPLTEAEERAWLAWIRREPLPELGFLRGERLIGFLHSPLNDFDREWLRLWLNQISPLPRRARPWQNWQQLLAVESLTYWDLVRIGFDWQHLERWETLKTGQEFEISGHELGEVLAATTAHHFPRDRIFFLLRYLAQDQLSAARHAKFGRLARHALEGPGPWRESLGHLDGYLNSMSREVRGALQRQEISLEQLAKASGVPPDAVAAYVRGRIPLASPHLSSGVPLAPTAYDLVSHTASLLTNPTLARGHQANLIYSRFWQPFEASMVPLRRV